MSSICWNKYKYFENFRSGLNVISEFNLDNTTNFNKEEGDAEGDRGEEAKKVEDINVDYSLYSKFWQIQDFFRYISESSLLHMKILLLQKSCSMLPKSALEAVQHVCSRRPLHVPGCHHCCEPRNGSKNNVDIWQSFKLDPTSGKSTVVGDQQEAEHYFAK